MFTVEPKILADTRNQLHWASQLLSAAADAKIPKAEDDSHSNLGWNATSGELEGRAGVSLNVVNFELSYEGESFSLAAQTLADGAKWLGDKIQAEIRFRDYEMPKHDVGEGGVFAPDSEHLKEIANWFSYGQKNLVHQGELRVWPHHFDLGFWKKTEVEGKSIGGGFSLGDHHYDQPYFYINPYGIDRPESLSELSHGQWSEHWFGAVLTADEIKTNPDHIAKHFVDDAVGLSSELLK